MIRFTPSNNAQPESGDILLSEPFLDDPYFGRKVVLLCEHNDEGSFGFVLNNFIDIDVDEVMEELPKLKARISVGGPVKNGNLYYLHTRGDIPESIPVVEGVCMGGDFDLIKKMLQQGELTADDIRFFIGYSGWSPSQLDHESKAGLGLCARDIDRTSCAPTKTTMFFGNGWSTTSATGTPTSPTPQAIRHSTDVDLHAAACMGAHVPHPPVFPHPILTFHPHELA